MNKRKFLCSIIGTSTLFPLLNGNCITTDQSSQKNDFIFNDKSGRELDCIVKLFSNNELNTYFGRSRTDILHINNKNTMLIRKENIMDFQRYDLSTHRHIVPDPINFNKISLRFKLDQNPINSLYTEFYANIPNEDIIILTLKNEYKDVLIDVIKEKMYEDINTSIPTSYSELTLCKNNIYIYNVTISSSVHGIFHGVVHKNIQKALIVKVGFQYGLINDLSQYKES